MHSGTQERRRKFYGWGYEGDEVSRQEIAEFEKAWTRLIGVSSAAFGAIISGMSIAFLSPISAGAAALSLGALLLMPLRDQETPPSARAEKAVARIRERPRRPEASHASH
jgi:hypothetical protein